MKDWFIGQENSSELPMLCDSCQPKLGSWIRCVQTRISAVALSLETGKLLMMKLKTLLDAAGTSLVEECAGL